MLHWWVGVLFGLIGASAAVCPQHCSCYTDYDGYVSANCSTLALQGAVEPSPIERLSLQPRFGSYPTKLAPRAFLSFQKIKFLWAINCSVLNLPTEVFHGLHYVIRIDLSFNKIRHLNGAVFKNLESLTTLKLRGNPLELTPWDVIDSDSLQELDLGHCGLRTIPFGSFVSVPRLSRLYLDGNELRTFLYNTIPAGLHYVNLARNRISIVPTDVLSTMSNLRKLDLSKNPINCTCDLLLLQDWFSGPGIIFDNGVTCVEPARYAGMRLNKINENELCLEEEIKRQRKINDIPSYRDSKSHRRDNMIHNPDIQSDQPDGQNYAEILFLDKGTRGQTHMELTDKNYPTHSDLSDESNKLATSKQELSSTDIKIHPPTEMSKMEVSEDIPKGESIQDTKSVESIEEFPFEGHNTSLFDFDDHTLQPNHTILSEDVKMEEEEHTTVANSWEDKATDVITNTSTEHENTTLSTKSSQEELADEGYSPVYNHDIMLSDEEGSGGSPDEFPTTDIPKDNTTLSPKSYTFPSSHADITDYNYDSHHDYSGEVTSTTEVAVHFEEIEGSGEPDNDTITNIPSVWPEADENITTSENYMAVDHSSDKEFSIPPNIASNDYSSTEYYNISSSSEITVPTESVTEQITTEIIVSSSTSPVHDVPISEPLSTTTESVTSPISETSIEVASTSPVPPLILVEPSDTVPPPETSSTSATTLIDETKQHEILVDKSTPSYREETTSTSLRPIFDSSSSSTRSPFENDVEVIRAGVAHDTNAEIIAGSTKENTESSLTYIILGLILALVFVIVAAIIFGKARRRPCASKKKVRLPQDTEANHGTEMQDMLLPKPPENGIKIISQNGNKMDMPNGKEMKEEELPVLGKDWEDKQEPIETVTARMSILAGPQTPVFIHKTLA